MAIIFDTLAFSKTLRAAGMPLEQADALAKAWKDALIMMLQTRESASQADMLRLEKTIEANKSEILKWIAGMLVAQAALLATVMSFVW